MLMIINILRVVEHHSSKPSHENAKGTKGKLSGIHLLIFYRNPLAGTRVLLRACRYYGGIHNFKFAKLSKMAPNVFSKSMGHVLSIPIIL